MKKFLIIICISLIIISCSKSSSDSSTPNAPVVTNLKVKYEMIFSSPLTTFPPTWNLTTAPFRVSYIDSLGNGAYSYPTLTGTSWSQDVTIVSKTRPIYIGIETTTFFLSAKGTIILNIYVNNSIWKTRTDSSSLLHLQPPLYHKASVGSFFYPYPN